MSKFRVLIIAIALLVIAPSTAFGFGFDLWVRGDGTHIQGDQKLAYFENNETDIGYGFAVGGKLLFVDLFVDANFFPNGNTFNQLGIGSEIDVIPLDDLKLAPVGQALYFFASHADDTPAANGFHARAGAQLQYQIVKFLWLGAEAFGGYVFAFPEQEGGFVWNAGAHLAFKVELL